MASIIEMPKLSDTMSVGTLVTWLKQEGDKVSSGDKIAEIETDKATMEMEVFEDGVLLKQIVAVGEQVAVGEPICAIGKEGEKVDLPGKKAKAPAEKPAPAAAGPSGVASGQPATSKTTPAQEGSEKTHARPAPATAAPDEPAKASGTSVPRPRPIAAAAEEHEEAGASAGAEAAQAPGGRIRISPLARKVAGQLKVDPASVKGTGPGGRIVKADVELAARSPRAAAAPAQAQGRAAPAPSGAAPAFASVPSTFIGTASAPVQEEKTVQLSNMRAAIARRLVESKTTIPHFYVEVEIDAAPMLGLRQQLIAAYGESARVSVNDFILKACAHALRRVPTVNSSWQGTTIQQHGAANVAFAVAIDDGLITPVIFDAHAKSLFQISAEARVLGAKAKAKKLQPNEFTGGTFCVSNMGMLGVERFSAIINPPNSAILAVGATVKKPVVNEAGEIVVGQRMSLTLSCDHRVVDGATGAQFLAALKEILEKPLLVLG